ncbi:MAG: hydroxymethylglutaryl-CoA lyase [Paracoccus sp. (in: a-proteobacteria)]|nr:hydroxymethylglutaryl-CoA lyase [Paracoccus sp. (in: a-proteobacteria)]
MEIEIFEMGPRDGLQNEKRMIPTADKIALVDLLSGAGFRRIEVTSFVSPKWVPQMADAGVVMAGIRRAPGVSYAVLTPNMRGYEAARAAGASEVAVFTSASEGFARANLNATIEESFERFAPVMAAAAADGTPVRGYVSMVTDCPFDGRVAPGQVARVAARLADMGCYEISLGDTVGRATPERIDAMLDAVLDEVPPARLAGHYHDTGGLALANIDASVARGLRVFDAAVGGLGGCPYAPGAAGNVATERVAAHLLAAGWRLGLNLDIIARAADFARGLRGQGDEA